jgi:hypothetical protein
MFLPIILGCGSPKNLLSLDDFLKIVIHREFPCHLADEHIYLQYPQPVDSFYSQPVDSLW